MTIRSNVDSAHFRELCGRFATGVVEVTATAGDGSPMGMTANSFASVSLDPPLVSINVEHRSDFHPVIISAPGFSINVEDPPGHHDPLPDRFAGVGYRKTDRGQIVLAGVVASIECEIFQHFTVGDHTIVIGRVVGGDVQDGRPLLYFRGGYRSLA